MKRLLWVICVGLVLSGCGREKARQQKIEYDTLRSLVFPSFLTEVYGDFGYPIGPGRTLPERQFQFPVGMTGREVFCRIFDQDPGLDKRISISIKTRREVCEHNDRIAFRTSVQVSGCIGAFVWFSSDEDVGPASISFALSCQPPPRKLNDTATTSYG